MKKLSLIAIATLILSVCVTAGAEELAVVYISSSAIQCESDGKTGAETAQLLTDQNITVTQTECGHLSNVVTIAMCGAPATNINVHTIASVDVEKAQALGFENVSLLKQNDHIGYDASMCK